MFYYLAETLKTVDQAAADIEQALAQSKFGVVVKLDLQKQMAEKGVTLGPRVIILEVCNPHKAKEAIESNLEVAFFLPCKMVVFDDHGRTKLGTILPTALAQLMPGTMPESLAAEVEAVLKAAVDAAK